MTTEQKENVSPTKKDLQKAASILQNLIANRFMTVELNSEYNDEFVQVTTAQFAIVSPPKRGVNSQSMKIRFCPITSLPLELFHVVEEGGKIIVSPRN